MDVIGFIVNPIAGMGGVVGLKGTDGREVLRKAIELGAKPIAPKRAREFLEEVRKLGLNVKILTAPKMMGEDVVSKIGLEYEVIGEVGEETTAEDTKRIAMLMLAKGVKMIVFVGGDGTARDILDAVDLKCPVLGIPSGVKMYSAVFTLNPRVAAITLKLFLEGNVEVEEREVLDIDEDAFRRNMLNVRLYGYLKVPSDRSRIQSSKEVYGEIDEESNKQAIATYFIENMERDTLYILGTGSTVKTILKVLEKPYTLLGIDALYNGEIVGLDLNEREILKLIEKYANSKKKLVLTPIGGQGFILGRGNQQLSSKVVERIGIDNIIVLATRSKVRSLKCLHVDTGDPALDNKFKNRYIRVIVDYNEEFVMKIC